LARGAAPRRPGRLSACRARRRRAPSAARSRRPRCRDGQGAIRVVDWTDPLCPHCAELHEVLDEIINIAPGSISVESHFFPLDGLCKPSVERKTEVGEVRCIATKALMCLEGDAEKFHLGQKLIFDNQRDLTVDRVWQLLSGNSDKKTLEACMTSPELQKKLDDDIASADANHLEGTPLVLMNGKTVKPFGPILYALALTGGKTKIEAFRSLPPPLAAHEGHDGHEH
jgi:serine/threonine-protein kinase